MEQDKCPVCLDNISENLCLNDICLTCRKIMCKSCLAPLEKCPHCRADFMQGTIKDIKRAEEILEKHKDYEYTHMIYYVLANIYKDNDDNNYKKYIKISADMGFSCAINSMAMDSEDTEEYFKYLNQAADKGCLTAIFNKAKDELNKENYDSYKELITKAADGGLPIAKYTLGCDLIEGQVFDKDFSKGFEYIENAADNGHVDASFELSNVYYNGYEDIVEPNKEKAIKYATFAAENGHTIASFNLGMECYYNKFYYEAFKWLKPLIDEDDKSAKLIMGKSFVEMSELMGDFILKEGLSIIAELADEKHPPALYELGLIYLEGNEIIDKDEDKSFILIKASAELNFISSYSRLSEMYIEGIGTEVNALLASKYAIGALMNIPVSNVI
jgi:uncharacterized protein